MRLTWHEAVVQQDRLIIRWPAEEKRLRTLNFFLLFAFMTATILAILRLILRPELGQGLFLWGLIFAGIVFCYGCGVIWFSRLWILDRNQNALLQSGWRKVAKLDEFSRFIAKREKRGRDIVFVVLAERPEGEPEILGVMDQEDANELGYQLARFTRLPFSSR